jgi:hypothetical protein
VSVAASTTDTAVNTDQTSLGTAGEVPGPRLGSVPEEEGNLAGLDPPGLVEECGEGASDRSGVPPALWKGLGRDENQPRMFLPGGSVPRVEWHEVLDVGGKQRASGGRCTGEDLIVRQGNQ